MNGFEADLKRAFAEAEEPVDTGFSVQVSHRVSGLERRRAVEQKLRYGALALGGLAALFGVMQLSQGVGLDLMAAAGLELAKAHGAMSQSEFGGGVSQGVLGMGLTQILMFSIALAGGALAFRQARD
jgi:hypothetical protein